MSLASCCYFITVDGGEKQETFRYMRHEDGPARGAMTARTRE